MVLLRRALHFMKLAQISSPDIRCLPNCAAKMSIEIKREQRAFNVNLWDTAGQEGFDIQRHFPPLFLRHFPGLLCKCKGRVGGRGEQTQIILSSLLWVPKQTWKLMKEQLLISKQRAQHPITYKKGVELAKRSSAQKYVMECSARFERFESNLHWDIIKELFLCPQPKKGPQQPIVVGGGEPDHWPTWAEVVHTSVG